MGQLIIKTLLGLLINIMNENNMLKKMCSITKYYNFDDYFIYRLKNNHNHDDDRRDYEEIFNYFSVKKNKKTGGYVFEPGLGSYRLRLSLHSSDDKIWVVEFGSYLILLLFTLLSSLFVISFYLFEAETNAKDAIHLVLFVSILIAVWIDYFRSIYMLDQTFRKWTIEQSEILLDG